MKKKLVYIEWLDHVGYGSGWKDFAKEVDNKPVLIQCVGWIIAEDAKVVSIASTVDTQNNGSGGKDISSILKNCIVKRKTIRL